MSQARESICSRLLTSLCCRRAFCLCFLKFPSSSAYIISISCRALLEGLYLFTFYALQCIEAFRNLQCYLGVSMHLNMFSFHRFCPIFISQANDLWGKYLPCCLPLTQMTLLLLTRKRRNSFYMSYSFMMCSPLSRLITL